MLPITIEENYILLLFNSHSLEKLAQQLKQGSKRNMLKPYQLKTLKYIYLIYHTAYKNKSTVILL